MIPTDHFVRYYNEVFKALEAKGAEHLMAYWREIGRLQCIELAERFKKGGIKAAFDYWKRIMVEENCQATMKNHGDWLELRMRRCPSLSKVMDNDAAPFEFYCDHCAGWVEPVMDASGLYAVNDMESRSEPHCRLTVFTDKAKALRFERKAKLPSHPYLEGQKRVRKSAPSAASGQKRK
jgi:hypothetical protein